MTTLDELATRLAAHRPRLSLLRHRIKRAAVAVVLRQAGHGVETLLIQRAEREGDPWSGHMAFPGGKLDPRDANACAAACRETSEETGLQINTSACIGRLRDHVIPDHSRRRPMVLSAFVFRAPEAKLQWHYNHEVTSHLWVPLGWLADDANRHSMEWRIGPFTRRLPCYDYHDHRIWGLTLMMLDNLMRRLDTTA